MQCLAQDGDNQQGDAAADESGDQLGPCEHGGQSFQHLLFQHAVGQKRRGGQTADDFYHQKVQRDELGRGGNQPGGDALPEEEEELYFAFVMPTTSP